MLHPEVCGQWSETLSAQCNAPAGHRGPHRGFYAVMHQADPSELMDNMPDDLPDDVPDDHWLKSEDFAQHVQDVIDLLA